MMPSYGPPRFGALDELLSAPGGNPVGQAKLAQADLLSNLQRPGGPQTTPFQSPVSDAQRWQEMQRAAPDAAGEKTATSQTPQQIKRNARTVTDRAARMSGRYAANTGGEFLELAAPTDFDAVNRAMQNERSLIQGLAQGGRPPQLTYQPMAQLAAPRTPAIGDFYQAQADTAAAKAAEGRYLRSLSPQPTVQPEWMARAVGVGDAAPSLPVVRGETLPTVVDAPRGPAPMTPRGVRPIPTAAPGEAIPMGSAIGDELSALARLRSAEVVPGAFSPVGVLPDAPAVADLGRMRSPRIASMPDDLAALERLRAMERPPGAFRPAGVVGGGFDVGRMAAPRGAASAGIDPIVEGLSAAGRATGAAAGSAGSAGKAAAAAERGFFGLPTATGLVRGAAGGAGSALGGALRIANKAAVPVSVAMGALDVFNQLADENSGLRQGIDSGAAQAAKDWDAGNYVKAITGGVGTVGKGALQAGLTFTGIPAILDAVFGGREAASAAQPQPSQPQAGGQMVMSAAPQQAAPEAPFDLTQIDMSRPGAGFDPRLPLTTAGAAQLIAARKPVESASEGASRRAMAVYDTLLQNATGRLPQKLTPEQVAAMTNYAANLLPVAKGAGVFPFEDMLIAKGKALAGGTE